MSGVVQLYQIHGWPDQDYKFHKNKEASSTELLLTEGVLTIMQS